MFRPIITEGCNVTLTELDTIYSFYGLSQLHVLLDIKMNIVDLQEVKLNQTRENSDAG